MIAELKNRNRIQRLPKPVLFCIKILLLAGMSSIAWMPQLRESLNIWNQQHSQYQEPGSILLFMESRSMYQDNFRPMLEWTIFSFCLVMLAEISETVKAIFSSSAAIILGKSSFGLYLCHLRTFAFLMTT
jgi:peptidoglycan/LPS O-acetylase OafA/YrhL